MAFSPLDSELLGPLFATDAMRAVFADRARLAAMLEAEAALARAQARFGIVPATLGDALAAIAQRLQGPPARFNVAGQTNRFERPGVEAGRLD